MPTQYVNRSVWSQFSGTLRLGVFFRLVPSMKDVSHADVFRTIKYRKYAF